MSINAKASECAVVSCWYTGISPLFSASTLHTPAKRKINIFAGTLELFTSYNGDSWLTDNILMSKLGVNGFTVLFGVLFVLFLLGRADQVC
jgi:hypothetical protein